MKLGHAEALEYLDGFEMFLAGTLARQSWPDHICAARFDATPNGSPEELVDSGVLSAAEVTGGWADQIVRALEPAHTERAILSVLERFESGGFRVDDFAKIASEKFLLSTMLGALDSQWERENEQALEPITFAIGPVPKNITGSSFAEALKLWDKQQVLTRPAFDALQEGTRRRAFTVAGIAKSEILDTVHAELRRQIATGSATEGKGVNLREFSSFARTRLESAGWTPKNPSHVETIFRTNVIGAMSSGRFTEMRQPAVIAALPFWQILVVRDPRTRETHRRAQGICLPADHAFWKKAYPPFGYNCRCKVCARTAAWMKRNGKEIGPVPTYLPDPGFDSGTTTLISVPDAALKQTPAEAPARPAAPLPPGQGLGAPSPFPAQRPGAVRPLQAPPSPAPPMAPGLGAPSPFDRPAPAAPPPKGDKPKGDRKEWELYFDEIPTGRYFKTKAGAQKAADAENAYSLAHGQPKSATAGPRAPDGTDRSAARHRAAREARAAKAAQPTSLLPPSPFPDKAPGPMVKNSQQLVDALDEPEAYGRFVRGGFRDQIADSFPGAVSKDLEKSGAGTVEVLQSMRELGVQGSHMPDGTIVMQQARYAEAQRGAKLLAEGKYGERLAGKLELSHGDVVVQPEIADHFRGLRGLNTMTHEELHGFSRNSVHSYRHEVGRVLEEVGTELSARHVSFNLTPQLAEIEETLQGRAIFEKGGAKVLADFRMYQDEIDGLRKIVEAELGLAPREARLAIIDAHRRGVLVEGELFQSADDHLNAFTNALTEDPTKRSSIAARIRKAFEGGKRTKL
jgi:hypothetical protein